MGVLIERDINDGWDDDRDYYWGYSPTAAIIKWTIVGVIVILICLWLIGGYFHAQRRMKKGLPPLLYHRFLVSRTQRMQFEPQPQFSFYTQQGQAYPMNAYPAPPPPYNPQYSAPPNYQPPEGASKVNPEQNFVPPQSGPIPPGPAYPAESSQTTYGVTQNQAPPPTGPVHNGSELPPRSPAKPSFLARLNPLRR